MGGVLSRFQVNFKIIVKTGDVKGSGTDSNVYCTLVDKNGQKSKPVLLDVKWHNDFERGSIDTFNIRNESNLDEIVEIILRRDESGYKDDWFVEYVKVVQYTVNGVTNENNYEIPFPCNRWVYPNKDYSLLKYDSVLPQFDPRKEQRKKELEDKLEKYKFAEYTDKMPRRAIKCPEEENFSNAYQWDIVKRKFTMLAEKKLQQLFSSSDWKDLNSLGEVYKGSFGEPYGFKNWKLDHKFAQQRLRGCNPTMLRLCKAIPDKMPVTDELLSPFLEGKSISEAVEGKRIFFVDLEVLHELKCAENKYICAPIVLFYLNDAKDLTPIAIQLNQTPADDNPIFTPNDPANTWLLAKMFYNNAECCFHQTCTHLGFTHLLVEALSMAVHRALSPSHPVFRLCAPHFLYLLAINSLAVEKLLSVGGWIDETMTMGRDGLFQILERQWVNWKLDVQGWLPNDLKDRGLDDAEAFPDYLYRDDSMLLHNAIYNYVKDVLSHVYDTKEKLLEDYEAQNFAALLIDKENGPGLKGVFGNGKFEDLDDLIKIVTIIIYTSSVQHAAANFCQYDEYAFPPNYPATLNGTRPTSKTATYTDDEVLDHLPSKDTTMSIMVVTKLLSERGTNALGDFEVQYQYEPHAVEAVERFRKELKKISDHIRSRNAELKDPYPYLDPAEVPNAISI